MKANIIKLYDLDAVTTTIVMREIAPNPDVQNIIMYDLDAVSTNIIMHYFGEGSSSTAWTLNLSDTITLSDAIVKGVGKFFADNITLSDQLSGITPQGGRIRTYRFFWLKIYVSTLEGRNVFRITIFD